MSGMIGHHAQAIKMAGMAPTHGASQAVLTLTERDHQRPDRRDRADAAVARRRRQPVPERTPRA